MEKWMTHDRGHDRSSQAFDQSNNFKPRAPLWIKQKKSDVKSWNKYYPIENNNKAFWKKNKMKYIINWNKLFWPVKLLKSQKLRSKTFFFLAWIKVLREADSLASSSKCRHIRQDWNWIFHSGRLPNCLGEVFESACDHFDSFSTTSKGTTRKKSGQVLKAAQHHNDFLQKCRLYKK